MRTQTIEQASADFWDWFGPKLDALDAENHREHELVASMPDNDPEFAMVTYGEEVDWEVYYEPVAQAPQRDIMAEVGVW
jgi:hypothetical protein